MANAFKRVAGYLGLVDDEEDLQPLVPIETPRVARPAAQPLERLATPSFEVPRSNFASAPVAPAAPAQPVYQAQPELPVMDQIFTIHPRFYNEARIVGERYREGQPVLINLGDMEESERKRLVDFASGLVFGHNGTIERVTSKVFLLTPPNVRVSTEHKTIAAEASFFNQS